METATQYSAFIGRMALRQRTAGGTRRIAAFVLFIAIAFAAAGCGRKSEASGAASKDDVQKLAAQVEALRKENEQLRSSAISSDSATTGEPTEAEMRQAIQDRIDGMNQNIAKMRNTRPEKGDAMGTLIALTGMAVGDTRYEIRAFQKLGAEKAQGKPGYVCDYVLQLRATGKRAAPLDNIMRWGGDLCTARFVKNGDRWIWIAPGDEG
jgi:hypothetical protein